LFVFGLFFLLLRFFGFDRGAGSAFRDFRLFAADSFAVGYFIADAAGDDFADSFDGDFVGNAADRQFFAFAGQSIDVCRRFFSDFDFTTVTRI
jgi:hypothetical protein